MRMAFVQRNPFGSLLGGAGGANRSANEALPARLDVVDQGDRFAVKVDLPGVNKEDINVAIEGARVSVSGATRRVADNGSAPAQVHVLRAERHAVNYARTLQLPAEVDGNTAEATFENGVLTLTLPKRVRSRQLVVR
jgi:HSP20 family protein